MSDQDVDWDSDEPIVESLMNRIAEMERLWVKVWEDCPNGVDGKWIDGKNPAIGYACPTCDGSGKVPAEGVQQAANGWWIAPYKMERR